MRFLGFLELEDDSLPALAPGEVGPLDVGKGKRRAAIAEDWPRGYPLSMVASVVNRTTVQINLRVPPELLEELDQWLEDINKTRRYPKLTRTDVIRSLLDWGVKERPEWVGK